MFLDVKEARLRASALTKATRLHPWPATYREWIASQRNIRGHDFQKARRTFLREHLALRAAYSSLVGRRNQMVSLRRHAMRARRYWCLLDSLPSTA